MKNTNVFSGLSWGDLGRYKARHDRTVREERARGLDGRIREFWAKPHNGEWAVSALDFCRKETFENKDIFGMSREAHRLPEIEELAKQLIEEEQQHHNEEVRLAAEAIDESIRNLSELPRTPAWIGQVQNADSDMRKASQEVRRLVRNGHILNQMVQETVQLVEAFDVDAKVQALLRRSNKDQSWAEEAGLTIERAVGPILSMMQEKALFEELKKEYYRVIRRPVYQEYALCLKDVEVGHWKQSNVRATFTKLDNGLRSLGFSMVDYIHEFNSRWEKAKASVTEENRRVADEEAARKKAEKERENRKKLEPYTNCLAQIDNGRAVEMSVRDEFVRLNGTLSSLTFDPNQYVQNFRERWEKARAKVNEEKRLADEKARKEQKEREAREREEKRRRAEQEAIAREKARKQAAAKRRRDAVMTVILCVLGLIVPVGSMIIGFYFLSEAGWFVYGPFVVLASCGLYIHMMGVCKDNVTSGRHVTAQILTYILMIVFSIIFDFGVWSMILSAAIIAILFNAIPRLSFDTDDAYEPLPRVLKCVLCYAFVFALVFGMEKWLPNSLNKSFWNALWLVPVILAIAGGLIIAAFSFSNLFGEERDEDMTAMGLTAFAVSIFVFVRAIVILCSIVPFSFGMFWFIVLMLITTFFGMFGCVGIGGGLSVINKQRY